MTHRRSLPALVHVECSGEEELLVRAEPPAPGSAVYTRLDRLIAKYHKGLRRVTIDAKPFKRFTDRNIVILQTLVDTFREAGVREFALVNGPDQAADQLAAFGLDDIRAA